MAGNAWEWVADWYARDYYARSPKGPEAGTHRVVRGGSWSYDPIFLRAAYRYDFPPDYRYGNLGFRCARGLFP
jgi:formylglycine-generating enzyme required for sulfatase activity